KRGKKAMEKLRNLIEYYVLERQQLTCLFVLIDSRLPPQTIDLEFIEWLGEEGIPFGIIFTKADKNKRNELKKNVDAFLNALRQHWEELPPHFVTSSEKGTGRNEVLDYIEQINHDLDQ
ncbi:MAG: YihA family ribosome biogenesis GTP-binding protein, partial [Alloprevotella sp.]